MKRILILIIISLFLNLSAQISDEKQNVMLGSSAGPPISVTIGGDFLLTGSFPAVSGERLDQFITRLYNEAKARLIFPSNNEKIFINAISKLDDYALRGIKVINRDGKETLVDLLKFRLTGNFAQNPYLKNDDVIVFPPSDLEYNFVEILGAVNKPIKFQYVEGDKLNDAIFFARGINKAYEGVTTALISRLSYNGKYEEEIRVNINDDFELHPGDRIRIEADQTKRKDYKVLVLGEVTNPGEYFITENSTTIKAIIKKAGGFTEKASLKDADVIRNFTKKQILTNKAINKLAEEDPSLLLAPEGKEEIYRTLEMLKMYRASDLYVIDTSFFNADNQLRILEGENRIDFQDLDSSNSFASQYTLQDGDIIVVPERYEAVYVFGQVVKTGYYNYVEGKNYNYYVEEAGGLTATAKGEDEIFVIKGKTREWISIEDDYVIEPGDFIYVLKEYKRTIWYTVSIIGTIAGILGSVATLVLLFK